LYLADLFLTSTKWCEEKITEVKAAEEKITAEKAAENVGHV